MRNIKEKLIELFSDKTEVVEVVLSEIEEIIKTLGKNITVTMDHNNSIGYVIVKGSGIVKVSRNENTVIIGSHGNKILDTVNINVINVSSLPIWNMNWCSDIEKKWLKIFSNTLLENDDVIKVVPNDETYYITFKLSSNLIYFTKTYINGGSCSGALTYIKDRKLRVGVHKEILEDLIMYTITKQKKKETIINLYKLENVKKYNYDQYRGMIIAAECERDALFLSYDYAVFDKKNVNHLHDINENNCWRGFEYFESIRSKEVWCTNPIIEFIGISNSKEESIIMIDFNGA